nr:hypothetical protein [Cytophagales bacterium]
MEKKLTLRKATLAAGVVAMSIGLFNSFSVEAEGGSGGYCTHSVDGDTGVTNFCNVDRCATLTGQGSGLGMCGSW